MKYLCLVYADEAKLNAMPQPDIDALIDEVLAGDDHEVGLGYRQPMHDSPPWRWRDARPAASRQPD